MPMADYYIDCVRKRKTQTLNDNNRPISGYTSTDIKGYIGRQVDKQIVKADKFTIESQKKFFTSDWDLQFGDLIVYEGKTYEVVSDPKNTAHRDDHIKAMLKKIENVKQ